MPLKVSNFFCGPVSARNPAMEGKVNCCTDIYVFCTELGSQIYPISVVIFDPKNITFLNNNYCVGKHSGHTVLKGKTARMILLKTFIEFRGF